MQTRRALNETVGTCFCRADDVNILGERVQAIKNYGQSLLVASREICLEVNAETTQCVACVETRMLDKS